MAGVATASGPNPNQPYETENSTSRISREGRRISYHLTVIQQPERARACGSGAKSSTDRRPVDPPPIVRFQIYEGEGPNQTEITSPYNANFFLYATLENARPIAHGRVPQSPGVTNTPVLTGTPVAGMSYLDRPEKAGYFIFPDLSVRHEGKYRLSFTLFEDTKEDKDKDPLEPNMVRNPAEIPQIEACRRLEVKSSVFDVFSAKKFPGLSESTALSRLVADQGCRVRIRRDVRMRRRDNKNPSDWDDYEEETAHDRAKGASSPDPYGSMQRTPQPKVEAIERPRSASAATYSATPQRRTSQQELASQYYQNQMPPHPSPGTQHAGFVSQPSYYAAPPYHSQQYSQQQPPPPPVPQLVHQYHHYSYPPPGPVPHGYSYMPQQQMAPMYEQPMPHPRQDSNAHANKPVSYEYQAPVPVTNSMGPVDQTYAHGYSVPQPMFPVLGQHLPTQSPTITVPSERNALPPLKTLGSSRDSYEPATTTGIQSESQMAGVIQSTHLPQSNGVSTKRAFGSAFDTQYIDAPLRSGARPDTLNGYANVTVEESSSSDDDSLDMETFRMSYRRADGTQICRPLPSY